MKRTINAMTAKSTRKEAITAPSSPANGASPLSSSSPSSNNPLPLNYHTNIGFLRGRQLSFMAALEGVVYTLRTQPNAWIELTALSVVALAGLWFGISALEWGLLGLTIALILALEAVNTSIEAVVDLVSPQYHPLAKIAKDTAAGAMVLAVLGSIFVAAAIIGPRLWQLLR
jgi:diacylglycerol kinase